MLAIGRDHARRRIEVVGLGAALSGKRALGHLESAQAEGPPVRPGAEVGALVRPFDDAVFVAVVPTVQDELVEASDAILDEVPHRSVAGQDRDELVGVAQRRLQ